MKRGTGWHSLMSETLFGNETPFKNNEKCPLFNLESYFRPQDIQIFVFNFWSCRKQFDLKDWVNFKIYDVTTWETNNCDKHIIQYLEK